MLVFDNCLVVTRQQVFFQFETTHACVGVETIKFLVLGRAVAVASILCGLVLGVTNNGNHKDKHNNKERVHSEQHRMGSL